MESFSWPVGLAHAFVVGANQNVNHVLDTEALLDARDARENFLREHNG